MEVKNQRCHTGGHIIYTPPTRSFLQQSPWYGIFFWITDRNFAASIPLRRFSCTFMILYKYPPYLVPHFTTLVAKPQHTHSLIQYTMVPMIFLLASVMLTTSLHATNPHSQMVSTFPPNKGWNCHKLGDRMQVRWKLNDATIDISLVAKFRPNESYMAFGPSGAISKTAMTGR